MRRSKTMSLAHGNRAGSSAERREKVCDDLHGQGSQSHKYHGREQAHLRDDYPDLQPPL